MKIKSTISVFHGKVMLIVRKIEALFGEYLQIFPATGLLGPRQVGKTTFVKEWLSKNGNIQYLDLEQDSDREKLSDAAFYFSQFPDSSFILDEVQFMPSVFNSLRGIIDSDRRPGRFILLGSASPDLIKTSADSLAGRIGYLELTPFLIPEVDNQEQLWVRGGFPLSYLAASERISVLWRRNFIKTYIQRDLGLLGLQANPQLIQRFWNMLASFHGNVWNAENFARSLGITRPTVNRYLDFMEGAYMIRVLHPWYKNIKKRLVKSPKVYVRDSGLLHVLSDLDNKQALLNHVQAGASWEGFVIEQIINSLSEAFTPWYYRTHQGAESDLLLEKNNNVVAAIEIKLGTNPKISKGFRTSIEDTGAQKAYVIANVEQPYRLDEVITVMNLDHFIRKELPEL